MFYACLSISYFFNRNLRPVLIFGGRGGGVCGTLSTFLVLNSSRAT